VRPRLRAAPPRACAQPGRAPPQNTRPVPGPSRPHAQTLACPPRPARFQLLHAHKKPEYLAGVPSEVYSDSIRSTPGRFQKVGPAARLPKYAHLTGCPAPVRLQGGLSGEARATRMCVRVHGARMVWRQHFPHAARCAVCPGSGSARSCSAAVYAGRAEIWNRRSQMLSVW